MTETFTCKRCLRPYVRTFSIKVDFAFCDISLNWDGCADCAYQIKRQLVDFMLKASAPTKKAQSKQRYIERSAREG